MNTTLSAGSAAGGGSFAVVTLMVYVFSLNGINLPDNVALAISALLTMVFHYLIALKLLPSLPGDPAATAPGDQALATLTTTKPQS
jgi:hypothetical protein